MKQYFYADEDQQFGPFSIEELKSKRIKKTTLVWSDGMEEWASAETIDELNEILISEPPPLPKKEPIPIIQTIEVKQPLISKTSSKYDLSYSKEIEATVIGILLLVAPNVFYFTGAIENFEVNRGILAILAIGSRIAIIVWVIKIATRLNRNSNRWGWFAFFLPSIALIIIGLLKKLTLIIEIDDRLSKEESVKSLMEKADKYLFKRRNTDAIIVYNKVIELDSKLYEAYFHRALTYYHKIYDYVKSKSDFEFLITEEKYLKVCYYYLGNIAEIENNIKKAVELWELANNKGNIEAQAKLDQYN